VQRWRVQIALRSYIPGGATMVFTGGARRGAPSEAEVMARFAESLGVGREVIFLEERATSTWENVEFSLPWVDGSSSIAFCSDPMHAARARRYALEQRPELRDRLVGADDYRFLERWWIKLPAMVYELSIDAYRAAGALGGAGPPPGGGRSR
jgi:uncharacterized SAM-binding protein YcdF (DUF218 family)